MPNDITVTKNTTSGSERWDIQYTADQAGTIDKTLLTAGKLLDRNEKVSITIPSGSATTPATTITPNNITISVNSSTGLITASNTQKTQSVTPTVSAGYISSGTAGTITVSAKSATSQLSTQAGTTISPTESEQTAVAANKYTLGAVKVGAISSTYVGSGITQRDSDDLTVSGATVTAPAGYYASSASKSVASMTLPTSASSTSSGTSKATIGRSTSAQYINIPTGYNSAAAYYTISATPNGSVTAPSSISGSSATVSTGTNTLTLTKTVSVTPNVTTAGYISSGTAGNANVSLTASVTTKGAATYEPSASARTIASGTYLTGTQTIMGVETEAFTASNIKYNTWVGIGYYSDYLAMFDPVVAQVTGTFTGANTVSAGQTAATADKILTGYSAWVNGQEVLGSYTGLRSAVGEEF